MAGWQKGTGEIRKDCDAVAKACQTAYEQGRLAGYRAGFQDGFAEGHARGVQDEARHLGLPRAGQVSAGDAVGRGAVAEGP